MLENWRIKLTIVVYNSNYNSLLFLSKMFLTFIGQQFFLCEICEEGNEVRCVQERIHLSFFQAVFLVEYSGLIQKYQDLCFLFGNGTC